ncbi:mycothiol transferase [Geodermatophilus sp. URMC 62]|uniref:mycothiol transferase n=1 Tax=Geodermatophilus sp. URMC 62 TaxID=3423414 RepID=UPI00406CBFC8
MSDSSTPSPEDVHHAQLRTQFEAFLDDHRRARGASLDGLTEEQARRSLVPSRTTLLGPVKHATFVERVWFDEAVTGRSRAEIGIPATPDESFVLDDDDTVAWVLQAHARACAASRRATSHLGFDDVVHVNRPRSAAAALGPPPRAPGAAPPRVRDRSLLARHSSTITWSWRA